MQSTYAVVADERCLRIEQEDLTPTLRPTDILVRAEASVVSAGTELAIYTAAAPGVRTPGSWNAYPWRPGYGLVGRVIAAGAQVAERLADRRVFCFGKHASLQVCDAAGGQPMTGAFAIDESLSAAQAVMARLALVALTGPQVTEFEAGDTVAVFGLGLVGNLAAQLYQLGGARVIGFDPVALRCERARAAGLTEIVQAPPEEQVAIVQELTSGRGASVTVDAVGHAQVITTCIQACATCGQVILLGSPRAPSTGNLTDVFRPIHNRWLTLRGALEWRLPTYPTTGSKHSTSANLQQLHKFIKAGQLHVDPLITHVIAPEQLEAAYLGLLEQKEQYLGVVIDWQASAAR